jgi:hypothetical protein
MPRTSKKSITVVDQGDIDEISEDLCPEETEETVPNIDDVADPDLNPEIIGEDPDPEVVADGFIADPGTDLSAVVSDHVGDTNKMVDPEEVHEIARAENEGMVAIVQPIPEDPRSTKQKIEDAELRDVIDRKLREVFQERARGRDLEAEEAETHEAYKEAKKAREAQDKRINEEIDALQALYLNEPDPKRYPLLDKPVEKPSTATTLEGQRRERVEASFPKPEAIPPLPAADYPEFLRRKQDAAAISLTGLAKGTIKYLVETLKLETVGALVRKLNAVVEGGAKWDTITGWTEKRQEQIVAMLGEFGDACVAEWDRDHAAVVASSEAPAVEANGQAPTEAKPKRSRKPKDAPLLDQAEEAGDA